MNNQNEYALRYYLPVAGPGTREPCRGDESGFRVCLGFTPKWYHDRLGIDFSRIWHHDPVYRYNSLVSMKQYLSARFPSIENFMPNPQNGIDYSCATLDGVYGSILISAIYGQKIHYFKDNWPSVDTSSHYTKEQLRQIPAFDPETNPAFLELENQMDIIENKWGKISGYLNYQGILNNAFKLRGQEIFYDMTDDPEFANWLFNHIYDTMLKTAKLVQKRQRSSGFEIDLFSCSNCVINMISPEMYAEFILPLDMKFSQEFRRFGIHTGNWDASPYLEEIRKIGRMGYLDMGIDSDMEKARRLFPDARRNIIYSPVRIKEYSLQQIKSDFLKIHNEYGPCDITLADIETDVSEEKVQRIVEIADGIAR